MCSQACYESFDPDRDEPTKTDVEEQDEVTEHQDEFETSHSCILCECESVGWTLNRIAQLVNERDNLRRQLTLRIKQVTGERDNLRKQRDNLQQTLRQLEAAADDRARLSGAWTKKCCPHEASCESEITCLATPDGSIEEEGAVPPVSDALAAPACGPTRRRRTSAAGGGT